MLNLANRQLGSQGMKKVPGFGYTKIRKIKKTVHYV